MNSETRVDAVSASEAGPVDVAPPGCAVADGLPAPVADARWFYPSADLRSALRVSTANVVELAESNTATVEQFPDSSYVPAMQLSGGTQLEQPSLSADGASYVGIRVTGSDRVFAAGTRMMGTYPFTAPTQIHVLDSGLEFYPAAGDLVSPPTQTMPRRMVLRRTSQVVELEESAVGWNVVRKSIPTELGAIAVRDASLSSDGLALTLVADVAQGPGGHVLRAVRTELADSFGDAAEIYAIPSLLAGGYATANCDALLYRVGTVVKLVR